MGYLHVGNSLSSLTSSTEVGSAHTSSKPLLSYEYNRSYCYLFNTIIIGRTSMRVVTSEDGLSNQHASNNNSTFVAAQCPRCSATFATPGNQLEIYWFMCSSLFGINFRSCIFFKKFNIARVDRH